MTPTPTDALTAKGRHISPRGERHGNAKLTDEIVKQIKQECVYRKSGVSCRALAHKYGVSKSAIQNVMCGKGWKHVI